MNWQAALQQVVAEMQDGEGFGTADCCQFAARYWEIMTGANPAASYDYSSSYGAAKLIQQHEHIGNLISAALGFAPDNAQRPGDIAVVAYTLPGKECSDIGAAVISDGFALMKEETGEIRRLPLSSIISSWSCPRR